MWAENTTQTESVLKKKDAYLDHAQEEQKVQYNNLCKRYHFIKLLRSLEHSVI